MKVHYFGRIIQHWWGFIAKKKNPGKKGGACHQTAYDKHTKVCSSIWELPGDSFYLHEKK